MGGATGWTALASEPDEAKRAAGCVRKRGRALRKKLIGGCLDVRRAVEHR